MARTPEPFLWLTVCVRPSFEAAWTFKLHVRSKEDGQEGDRHEYALDVTAGPSEYHEVTWSRGSSEQGTLPLPDVPERSFSFAVPEHEGKAIVAGLSRLSLATVPPAGSGRDGTTFTVEIENLGNHSHFHWWCSVPAQWAQLGRIVDEILAMAEMRCPDIAGQYGDWRGYLRPAGEDVQ